MSTGRLRPHGKQAARKQADKAGTNKKIANEAGRLDSRIDERYTKSEIDNNFYDATESYSAAQVDALLRPKVSRVYPSLSNGWVNASGFRSLSYYQNRDGEVIFRGAISGGAVTDGTTLFRLVSAVWPASGVQMKVSSPNGPARVTVDTQGYVTCAGMTNAFAGFDNVAYSLD